MLLLDAIEKMYASLLADRRLSVWHLSICTALVLLWCRNGFANSIPISRKALMELAHIHSIATYHKCIKQLQDFGYIRYEPSFNPFAKTVVHLDVLRPYLHLWSFWSARKWLCSWRYLNVSNSARDIFSDSATLFSVLILGLVLPDSNRDMFDFS